MLHNESPILNQTTFIVWLKRSSYILCGLLCSGPPPRLVGEVSCLFSLLCLAVTKLFVSRVGSLINKIRKEGQSKKRRPMTGNHALRKKYTANLAAMLSLPVAIRIDSSPYLIIMLCVAEVRAIYFILFLRTAHSWKKYILYFFAGRVKFPLVAVGADEY